jgi:hypothetical protein
VCKQQSLVYRDFYGKDDANILVVYGTTLQFNPSIDKDIIERALTEDPERYGAEYLSKWRDDYRHGFLAIYCAAHFSMSRRRCDKALIPSCLHKRERRSGLCRFYGYQEFRSGSEVLASGDIGRLEDDEGGLFAVLHLLD